MNRFQINVPGHGTDVRNLIALACGRLGLIASRHYLLSSDGSRLKDISMVMPFSQVDLACYDDTGDNERAPTLQSILYDITSTRWAHPRDELFQMAAADLFVSLQNHLIQQARYRNWSAVIEFPETLTQSSHFVPSPWLTTICTTITETQEQNTILLYLETRCAREGMIPGIEGRIWTFGWRKSKLELTMPRIMARDLIQMGYNPARSNLFAQILNGLRRAIENNEVSADSDLAQKDWVRKNFFK